MNKEEMGDKNRIKLGVIAGPENELWEKIKIIALKKENLIVDLVIFNDYMTPNIALNDKSIDANSFQHEPFLQQMVKNKNLALVSVGKTFIFPLTAYSKKISSRDQIKAGMKIAIPNDPTNEGRALLLLDHEGLITLKDPSKIEQLPHDISENPLNLKIIELEAAHLPRALDDVDIAIINTTFSQAAGLNPSKDGLFKEDSDSYFVNVIAVRREDKDALWVRKLLNAVHNPEVSKIAAQIFDGAVVPGWQDD
jgi:D-methionine transport system substrate-binding protein